MELKQKQTNIFDQEIPTYQVTLKNTISLVLFTASFALVFLNLYAPFGFRSRFWVNVTDLQLLLYSSIATLTGILVVVISRLIMLYYNKKFTLKYKTYFPWIILEILAMALFYTILQDSVLKDERSFYDLLKLSVRNTTLVLLLPYSVAWLYFSWVDKNLKLADLLNNTPQIQNEQPENLPINMITFNDSAGNMRISIKSADLYYIEAADNYVKVFYKKGNKLSRTLIRNTLKNVETDLKDTQLVRCHRSYIINFEKVKVVEKDKNGLQVLLDFNEDIIIPISKTYAGTVMSYFANSGVDD